MAEQNDTLERPVRLKRLRMRAWRRGMKEMDLILGGFVDMRGSSISDEEIDALETLMNRQDQQLFMWISGATDAPPDCTDAERRIVSDILERKGQHMIANRSKL